MIENIKLDIRETLIKAFSLDDVVIEVPKKGFADLAIPLFAFAKTLRKSPQVIFEEFKTVLSTMEEISTIEFMNGFLNIFLERKALALNIVKTILNEGSNYGSVQVENPETVCIDYSSPNIAKSFSVGHLRSTMIGNSLKLIYQKSGDRVVAINHLGDWGTQFGKMIVSYKTWGDEAYVKEIRIPIL